MSDILQNLFSSFFLAIIQFTSGFLKPIFLVSVYLDGDGFIIINYLYFIQFLWRAYHSNVFVILFLWVKWGPGKMEIKIRRLQKNMKFLSFFYLSYNIKSSWLDSFWCLIFVEFDRNECFQIWHKVLLIDFTMSLFMDSTELWNSDFKGIHF